jgi:signal transduction histidine kinase
MDINDIRPLNLFDSLTDAQLGELLDAGTEISIEPGVELFHQGDHADYWWVLVDGALDLMRYVGREQVVVGKMDVPGRWAGGFRGWDEHGVYLATGRGTKPGRALRVPAPALRACFDQWFPFGGHLFQGLYSTARSIESTARQRESLQALGTLAAGLAHEINNPAAAATRAVDALGAACDTLLGTLGRLAEDGISAQQFSALDELRNAIEPPAVALDPLALTDLEDELADWLSGRGLTDDWIIAPQFAAAGVDTAWCERAAVVLDGPALQTGLQWVASTLTATALLAELKDSTQRITDLVGAVRSYSQMDRASRQRFQVTDGLDSTITIMGHRLGNGIVVVRDYDPELPQIDAYAGELNQVWTNLIDNAIDAMDGSGTLTLTARLDGDRIAVEIGDTGVGMAPEVVARAFEPFYSTKGVGKGTGLGLDIAQRIVVERHRGSITIDSGPGRTVLRVRIPLRPAG